MISYKKKIMGILFIAFLLRMIGIGFGLPHIYHQDEPIIVNHALSIGAGGWNTHFFVIPPFTIYFFFIAQGVYFVVGKLIGIFQTSSDFALMFMRDPTSVYWIGRFLLGVCFGTTTVWALWVGSKRFFGERVAFWAALLLAITPLHVQHSHYIYADIPLTLVVTISYFVLLSILEAPLLLSYLRFGALMGWAASIKYTGLYFAPMIGLAHMISQPKNWYKPSQVIKLILSGASCITVFFIFAPFSFLDWKNFWGQIRHQGGAGSFVGLTERAVYSIVGGSGVAFVSLGVLGLIVLAKNDMRKAWITAGLLLVYYGINVVFSQNFARYMLPLMPVLALLAAMALHRLGQLLEKKRGLMIALLTVLCAELLAPTVYLDALFLGQDTRTECAQWFADNVDESSPVAVDNRFFGPPLPLSEAQIKGKYAKLGGSQKDDVRKKRLDLMLEGLKDRKGYNVYQLVAHEDESTSPFLFMGPFVKQDWDSIEKAGVEYIVIHTTDFDQSASNFVRASPQKAELLRSFSPYRDPLRKMSFDPEASTAAPHLPNEIFSRHLLGPYLEVYRVKRDG